MLKNTFKNIILLTLCTVAVAAAPIEARADQKTPEHRTSTSTIVRVEDELAGIFAEPADGAEMIAQVTRGVTCEFLEMGQDGWVRVRVGDTEGYINGSTTGITMAETMRKTVVDRSESLRMKIVEFAKQFIGRPYVWGGVSPNGFDCSGFTLYVMKHVAGVNLSHSSRAQANEGRRISPDEMRPGDLICYGKGKNISHVTLYIGDGQVVHSSTERTGVKISPWNYRSPIAIVNVLGD